MFNLGITAYPTPTPPPIEREQIEEQHGKQKIFKFPWRISMLAIPKHKELKYDVVQSLPPPKPPRIIIDKITKIWNEQISMPWPRKIKENMSLFKDYLSTRHAKNFTKLLKQSEKSFYKHYEFILHQQRMRKLKRIMQKRRQAMKKRLQERKKRFPEIYARLSKPKLVHRPPRPDRGKMTMTLEQLIRALGELAEPKQHPLPPPKELGYISPAALKFQTNEFCIKISQQHKRFDELPPPPKELGVVTKGALRYKASERILNLATPVARKYKAETEEGDDHWAIKKTALKYKATPRIIELSKPLERD